MADLKQLSNFPSPFLKPRFFSPLPPPFNFFPLRPRLSLFPTLCSPSNPPNLLLISTSLNSDGSVVFKFGDASEIPPIVEDEDNDGIVAGDDDATEAAYHPVSNVENVDDDGIEADSGSKSDDNSNESVLSVDGIEADSEIESNALVASDDESDHSVSNVEIVDVVNTVSDDDEMEADYHSVSNVENVIDDGNEADSGSKSDDDSNQPVLSVGGIEADSGVESNALEASDDESEHSVSDVEIVDVVNTVSHDDETEADYHSVSNVENVVDYGDEAKIDDDSNQFVSNVDGIEADLGTESNALVVGDDEWNHSLSNVEINDVGNTVSADDETEVGSEIESDGNLAGDDHAAHFVSVVENDAENDTEMEDLEIQVLDSKNAENDAEDYVEVKYSENEVLESKDIAKESVPVPDSVADKESNLDGSIIENDVEVDNKTKDSPIEVKSNEDIAKDEQSRNLLVVASDVDDGNLDVITMSDSDVGNLDSEVALEDGETDSEETVVEVIEELMEMLPVQLEEEPFLDKEVNDAGLSTIGGLEDSPTVDIADSLFPNLEESVVSAAVAIVDSDTPGQGIDKGLYAQQFIQNCEYLATKKQYTGWHGFKELLQQSAAMTDSPGAARVLIAHIADQVLHVANIGDAGFIIIRNGAVFKKSSPMFHEFNFPYAISSGDNPVEPVEEYHVELQEGDIIVAATDGLFDNMYEREIASLVYKAMQAGKCVKDIAELLASRSHEVGRSPYARTPFADAAQEAGHPEFSGGKFDHVTVIVSVVQEEQVPSSRLC